MDLILVLSSGLLLAQPAAELSSGSVWLGQEEAPSVPAAKVERRLGAMGTTLEVAVEARDRGTALAASEAAVGAIEACEARLSTWRDDSELARLNRMEVGEPFELSEELAADLSCAAELWRATGGAFDPGLGALVEAWGLRTGGRQPGEEELRSAREAAGFAGFALDGRRIVRLHPLARIEEGAFGKGRGLDAAAQALEGAGAGAVLLDLGGQLLVRGARHVTSLADPRDRARPVLAIECAPGSFATSGNSERGIHLNGVRLAHILDPRSGLPARDWGSMSVWAPDATTADGLSTGLYVLGPEEAFRWRATAPMACEIVALELLPEGRLRARASAGLRGRVQVLVDGLELVFLP